MTATDRLDPGAPDALTGANDPPRCDACGRLCAESDLSLDGLCPPCAERATRRSGLLVDIEELVESIADHEQRLALDRAALATARAKLAALDAPTGGHDADARR